MTVRGRACLALLLYVGVGLGTPMADALVGHDGLPERAHHVESTGDVACHTGACVLDAPGAPQSPARSPLGLPPVVVPAAMAAIAPPEVAPRRAAPAGSLGARAPPHSD